MYPDVSQASLLNNPPEGQRYRIGIYRASVRPDEHEIISIKANTKLNPQQLLVNSVYLEQFHKRKWQAAKELGIGYATLKRLLDGHYSP